MSKVLVNPGVCGFVTSVHVVSPDGQTVDVSLSSGCEHVMAMEAELKGLDSYGEVLSGFGASQVFKSAAAHCRHAACPVPTAILKAIEVEARLALARPVSMEIEKE